MGSLRRYYRLTNEEMQDEKMNENKMARQMLRKGNKSDEFVMATATGNNSMLAQVVGIILESPEFQRR